MNIHQILWSSRSNIKETCGKHQEGISAQDLGNVKRDCYMVVIFFAERIVKSRKCEMKQVGQENTDQQKLRL